MPEFDELYISIDKETKKLMRNILKDVLRIDPQAKIIVIDKYMLCKKFGTLEKILAAALAYKAMEIDGIRKASFTPKELSQQLSIKPGTVRPILRDAVKNGYLIQKRKGEYEINPSLIPKIGEMISQAKTKCQEGE